MRLWIFLCAFLCTFAAHAGVVELSFSGSHTESTTNEFNYLKRTSLTGSVSYYFLEMSAIEISYTNGEQEQSVAAPSETAIIYTTQFVMLGADLVLSLASRKSAFQPFIKAGGAQIKKETFREDVATGQIDNVSQTDDNKTVPTAGAGFRLRFTQTFSLKVSYDIWRSAATDDSETWDRAARAGISWMF